jgi:hypothetical protein
MKIISQLQPGTQQVVAFGFLGGLIAFFWLGLAHPMLTMSNDRAERRSIALRALKRDRALLHGSDAIEAALAAVDQSPRWHNFYEAQKAEAATLQLEADLRTLLKESNNPTTMSAESAIENGPVTRLAVRLTLSMRIDELATALDRIQKYSKQLRIESLTIQAPDVQNPAANPILTVQAVIAGWMVRPSADRT